MARRKPADDPSTSAIDDQNWKQVLENEQDPSWHFDYVTGRIMDVEEKLHFQLMWQRVGRLWLVVGNLTLLALAVFVSFIPAMRITYIPAWVPELSPYLYASAILSIGVSLFVVYRQYKRTRATRFALKRLNLVRRRKLAAQGEAAVAADGSDATLANQKRYRDDMPDLISQYRDEANANRRTHNRLQTVVIVGSVLASATTTASVSYSQTRWFAVAVTAAVGLAAGFTGYFKYHERSFSAQQTADSIEREYEAVELRVGKYFGKTDKEAYNTFADVVETLRDEQNKRQQQLDQPAEAKRDESR